MPWLAAAGAILSVAQQGASQSSENANGGKDITGGGLGKLGSIASAVGSAVGSAAAKPAGGAPDGAYTSTLNQTSDPTKLTGAYGPEGISSNYTTHFFGGESCDAIRKSRPVPIIGGGEIIKSSNDKSFYKNVAIPTAKT